MAASFHSLIVLLNVIDFLLGNHLNGHAVWLC